MSTQRYFIKQYLLHVSYMGTNYHGVANNRSVDTISGSLEKFMVKNVAKIKPFGFEVSSRTDRGVHAFWNTIRFLTKSPYSLNVANLRYAMNNHFMKERELIRVHQIKEIPYRTNIITGVLHRTYLYRIAVGKHSIQMWNCLTAWENCQMTFIRSPFDESLFKEAANVLSGNFNYCGFTNLEGMLAAKSPIKTVNITVKESRESIFNMSIHPNMAEEEPFRYYDVFVTSQSFMNRMVRYLVGCMVDVALGTIDLSQAQDVLNRGQYYLQTKPFECAPPDGLYLYDIKYLNDSLNFDINQWRSEKIFNIADARKGLSEIIIGDGEAKCEDSSVDADECKYVNDENSM